MSRLIDADALKLSLMTVRSDELVRYCYPCEKVLKKIDEQPTIEERKTGIWIPEFNGAFTGGAYWFSCSRCGRIVPDVRNGGWDFCPKCGSNNGRT